MNFPMNPPSPTPAKFSFGQIVATPGALALLERYAVNPLLLLGRHLQGDWGDVSSEDDAANKEALALGLRILSSYPVAHDRVWIITEADRSSTCILLPCEY